MTGKRGAPYGNRNAAGPHGGRQGPAKIKLPFKLVDGVHPAKRAKWDRQYKRLAEGRRSK